MRGAVGLIASRVLGTRYGIALLLAAVVFGVVGIGQLVGPAGPAGGGLRPDTTADAGAGSGVAVNPSAGDDGERSAPPTPQPVTSPGATAPERVAELFAAAWIDHRGVDAAGWLTRLRPYATPALADKLSGADPAGVPAERITGSARLAARGESYVEVAVPVDSGLLHLHLVGTDGRWSVDTVDWERR
jgi:hypothetical protein